MASKGVARSHWCVQAWPHHVLGVQSTTSDVVDTLFAVHTRRLVAAAALRSVASQRAGKAAFGHYA